MPSVCTIDYSMKISHVHIISIFIQRTEAHIHLVLKTLQQMCVHTEFKIHVT